MQIQAVFTPLCSNQIYDRHCHTHYEIIYVLDGSVTVNLEGTCTVLKKGSCIVIEPLRYHIVAGNNTLYNRLLVDFQRHEIPEDIFRRFHTRILAQPAVCAQDLCESFEQLYGFYRDYGDRHEPLLQGLFTQILYKIAFMEAEKQNVPMECKSELLRNVIDYVECHIDQTVRLRDVAEQMFVSESTLCHLFKDAMKIPLKQYILRKKMMYAKSLILSGATPSEAAQACGYKNYVSFYKMFLKFAGMAPGQLVRTEKEM